MAVTVLRHESDLTFGTFDTSEPCSVEEATQEHQHEALDFLSVNPIHTVLMAGLIRENGLLSPHNRGSFYVCRDPLGRLEGVALMGHVTVLETNSEASLVAFAGLARHCRNIRIVRGEREKMNRFWRYYAESEQQPRLISHELLFEQRQSPLPQEPISDLQPVTLNDLDQVMKINAAMALEEGGVSPLQSDPGGFRNRTARRIEQGRVWAWIRKGRLVFKADIMAEAPQAVYLEGVYVDPEERLKGHGQRCLKQLGSILLERSQSICLTINEKNKGALAFYAKAGYRLHSHYETIYLQP